jgi:FkbM family methyltransferase
LQSGKSASPIPLQVKEMRGNPLLCRPQTSDPWVMWDTFYYKFQTPPPGIAPAGCIVDLGANVGYTTAYFAAQYPSASILAVEMDSENAKIAAANLAPFGSRCHLVHAAVWSKNGETEYAGTEEQGYRVLSLGMNGNDPSARKVITRSLDSLFDEYRLTTIDYLKMDIEGAEAEVLGGSVKWAERVRAMKIELHKPATYESCSEALSRIGFKCSHDRVHPNCLVAVREHSPAGSREKN